MNTDKIYAESVAKDYAPRSTGKITALKKLDRKAKLPAEIFTYTMGVISSLILGTGMCLCMQVIGPGTPAVMATGIIVGIIGIAGICINYPLYKRILESGKKKYAFEIMELAKEIAEE